jgi:hypothetical protein
MKNVTFSIVEAAFDVQCKYTKRCNALGTFLVHSVVLPIYRDDSITISSLGMKYLKNDRLYRCHYKIQDSRKICCIPMKI